MAFSVVTWPLFTSPSSGSYRAKSASDTAELGDAIATTGLNIVKSTTLTSSSWLIGFDGDVLDSDNVHLSINTYPCHVKIQGLTGQTSATLALSVSTGHNPNGATSTSYTLDYTKVGSSDSPVLVVIKQDGKALLTIVSQTNPTQRIMGVLMDSTLRQIVALKYNSTATTPTIGDFYQGGTFDIRSETFAIPYSYGETIPPGLTNDERVVSMAPLAVPELLDVFTDVFSPIYMRASQSFQQFDIGADTFVTSGNPISATGTQFVVRFSPSQNQS